MPKFEAPSAAPVASQSTADIPVPIFENTNQASSRIASTNPGRGIVSAPQPFEWQSLGNSAGGRPIPGITVGQGGYRTLILGSLGGNDPAAISLTEKLAHHIHANSIILGGIEATVVRTANPDGEALYRAGNGNNIVLNRQFPDNSAVPKPIAEQEPEVRLLRELLDNRRPQRVIHIRTYPSEKGIIAASKGGSDAAQQTAEWLGFDFIALPGQSRPGTLERYLSEQESRQMITFAFPRKTDASALWEEYGDSLLNLLLNEDYETRKLARQQETKSSADRRGQKNAPRVSED
jgi:hypothetical protein